ncbi:hypothetical protein [Chryseobacterium sp.]|uniref:FEKKY domain-containing protein n=1 Tax=Chryseobacterium sp. TaxID=1871047 RepID=UPI003218EC7E
MIKNLLLGILMITATSCDKGGKGTSEKGQKQSQETYYTILSYGFPNMERRRLMEGVSEKWKIKNIDVAGCEVTQELMDSVVVENKKTYAALEKRYGKDWEIRYEKDMEAFVMKQVDIMDILIVNKPFREKLKSCNIEIDGVNKDVRQIRNSEVYEVTVYDMDKNYKKIICCTMQIDTKNRTVNLIK